MDKTPYMIIKSNGIQVPIENASDKDITNEIFRKHALIVKSAYEAANLRQEFEKRSLQHPRSHKETELYNLLKSSIKQGISSFKNE